MGLLRLVTPDLCVQGVLELDIERLRELGLDSLLLDVDCTLKNYTSEFLQPEVVEWLESLRTAGIGVCLVSNGRGRRIGRLAARLGVPFACRALKPLPFRCRSVLKEQGFDRRRTAIVGDQLFADVMAGRLVGLTTILVRPIHPEEEPWFTRIKRPLERIVLRRMERRKPRENPNGDARSTADSTAGPSRRD